MSTAVHIAALILAMLCIPTIGGLTAWGLAGGDGVQDDWLLGILAVMVGFGSIYTAVTCWTAFWGLADWRWWLMFVPSVAGILGLVYVGRGEGELTQDWVIGAALQLVMVVPPLLLLVAGVATP